MVPKEALTAVARLFGARVRRIDGNFPQDGGKLVATARFRFGQRRVQGYATQTRVVFEIQQAIQNLCFSVNLKPPDYPRVIEVRVGKLRVFVPDESYWIDPKAVKQWILNGKHTALLKALQLREEEYLKISGNEGWLSLKPDRDLRQALERVEPLLEALPLRQPIDPLTGIDSFPEILKPLGKYFVTWAISDDAEREERLRKAGKTRRDRVRAAVEPLFPEIDRYLASLEPGSESIAALNLGHLAEAVAEMRVFDEQ
jgi:hypothetical protein